MTKEKWTKIEPVAEVWDYKVDQELVGTYQGKEEEVGPNKSNLYSFETDGGVVSVWGNTILDTRFKNLNIGEKIKIVYLGKVKSEKTNREYHNFDVFKDENFIPTIEEEEVDVKDLPL